MNFSTTLRELCRQAGNQGELAKEIGITPGALSKFLGGGGLKIGTVDKIFERLELSVAQTAAGENKIFSTAAPSVQAGYVNDNQQRVVGPSRTPPNHPLAQSLEMVCVECREAYTANSCDCWQRRCPNADCKTNDRKISLRGTSEPGHINKNNQQVIGPGDEPSNHPFATAVKMVCLDCDSTYTANSCDCWQAKCTNCPKKTLP